MHGRGVNLALFPLRYPAPFVRSHTTPQNDKNMTTIPFSEYIYPAASDPHLRDRFLGKRVEDLPTPVAILDERVLRRNCELMLQATEALGIGFRPHVKTHKVSVD